MYKKSSSIFTIVFKSLTGFFENFSAFFKCLLPPVLLLILTSVILAVGMFFVIQSLFSKNYGILLIGLIITIVCIVFLCKAMWDFLIRMGALVLISKQIVENEPLRSTKYYVDAFKARKGYIVYLLITSFLIPLIPVIFMIPNILNIFALSAAGYTDMAAFASDFKTINLITNIFTYGFGPFLIVTFESFALNPKMTVWESIVKGMRLSGGKYFQSLGILVLFSLVFGLIMTLLFVFGNMVHAATGISSKLISIMFSLILLFLFGYVMLCFTWWYLRLEKEAR